MSEKRGTLSISSENIFPIIKKWMYSDQDIFIRELISNGCDAITKLKKLEMMGEYEAPVSETDGRKLLAVKIGYGIDLGQAELPPGAVSLNWIGDAGALAADGAERIVSRFRRGVGPARLAWRGARSHPPRAARLGPVKAAPGGTTATLAP